MLWSHTSAKLRGGKNHEDQNKSQSRGRRERLDGTVDRVYVDDHRADEARHIESSSERKNATASTGAVIDRSKGLVTQIAGEPGWTSTWHSWRSTAHYKSLVTTVTASASQNRFIMVWIGNSPAVAFKDLSIGLRDGTKCSVFALQPNR